MGIVVPVLQMKKPRPTEGPHRPPPTSHLQSWGMGLRQTPRVQEQSVLTWIPWPAPCQHLA